MSIYLKKTKTILKQIVHELSKDFQYVSILAIDTKGKTYDVKKTGVETNDSFWNESGRELQQDNGFIGPKTVKLFDINVAGIE